MNRTVLIASNDALVREIMAKFFTANGFAAHCIACDEQLLSRASEISPQALICESALQSRFFSPFDSDSLFSLLLALRCRMPLLPMIILDKGGSPEIERQARQFDMSGYFRYPPDLPEILTLIRSELRRIKRLKVMALRSTAEAAGGVRRGRPRKYPRPVVGIVP